MFPDHVDEFEAVLFRHADIDQNDGYFVTQKMF
ncbi:hypothetical protein FHT93_003899 [Rhizobium sp. BK379]|nr:hypothetical protein [Rhizobium sp. BK379]